MLIGERKVIFYYGERFEFERVGKKKWRCVSGNPIIPHAVIEDLD